MPTERVIEVPWALSQIPQNGDILDVGSCDATYLPAILQPTRNLHCLDPRNCRSDISSWIIFHHGSIIGNALPSQSYDAVTMISVLEHIGLPCYGLAPFANGDTLAVAEIWRLLKPGAPAIITVPAGCSKITSWYRQYNPARLHTLFRGWDATIQYWGYQEDRFVRIIEEDVEQYDYRDAPFHKQSGAGAVACILAYRTL